MISREVREAVRARVDLAELVSQYVPLRRSGLNMVARCPFHEEKSASFNVSTERGLFHCFGCKASGDVFTFYERIEGLSFPDALRALAERAGIEIVEEARDPQRVAEDKRAKELTERLYHCCEVATQFYEQRLALDDEFALMARDAIAERGVDMETAARFRIGYAPAQWGDLAEHLKASGISPNDAEAAGVLLSRKSGGGFYDRFRHRLMFPIWDRTGKVVAFSGRILPVTEGIAEGIVPAETGKYVNSPETPLFKKSEALFGLQVARNVMRQKAEAILVEGNFDVVSMHAKGFAETVAPLGTAFTETQARLLRRSAETVTLLFDADEAGRKAMRAAQGPCAKAGLTARVVVLARDVAKDPDELLRREGGVEYLKEKLAGAMDLIEWIIEDAGAHAGDTTQERVAAFKAIAPVINEVRERLTRESYIDRARMRLHLDAKEIRRALEDVREERENTGPMMVLDRARPPVKGEAGYDAMRRQCTADVITTVLKYPDTLAEASVVELLSLLDGGFAQPFVAEAREQWLTLGKLDGAALLELTPDERTRAWIASRIVNPNLGVDGNQLPNMAASATPNALDREKEVAAAKQALVDCRNRLQMAVDLELAQTLKLEAARARAAGDDARALELLQQAQQIDRRRHPTTANRNRGAA